MVAATKATARIETNILDLFQLETRCSDGLNGHKAARERRTEVYSRCVWLVLVLFEERFHDLQLKLVSRQLVKSLEIWGRFFWLSSVMALLVRVHLNSDLGL